MQKELYLKQLTPCLYLMDEAHEASGYIVVGDDKACVIDTMNGFNDLHAVVRKITDKPVIVINTHGHSDHIYGNVYFDEVYMNPKDNELASSVTSDPNFRKLCKTTGHTMPSFKPVTGGDVIDLGNKTLEIYDVPGHTPGSIVILLKEDRILFSGDAINNHLWMQLECCSPLSEYVKILNSIMDLEEKADYILHGHAPDFDDISLLRCLRKGVIDICNNKTSEDQAYLWFGRKCLQHTFALEEGKKYSRPGAVICYNP